MKKLLSVLVLALCLALGGLVACSKPAEDKKDDPVVPTTYTVAFEYEDGTRYATEKVKAGETIAQGKIVDPTKTGFDFDYWTLNGVETDIYAYAVNGNVTFVAHFTEKTPDPVDPVDDDTNYFNVYIQVNGTYLTEPEANTFKERFLATLSEEEAAITRFYINDADATTFSGIIAEAKNVDAVIGGNKPLNTFDYNKDYYNTAEDKLTDVAAGHFTSTNRKIIIMTATDSLELAVKLYNFATVPYVDNTVNLTVTVHGDTDVVTTLTDSEMKIVMPTITVTEDKVFRGFATAENGEVVLVKAADAELTFNDVKDLVADGATALDLYPVIETVSARTHYVKVAWYNKPTTSGIDSDVAAAIETALKDYLLAEGVSQAEVDTVEFVGIEGNVKSSTEAIVTAGDVDIMLGWANNISSTGVIPAETVVESIAGYTMGTTSGRYVQRLSSDETVVKAMEFFRTVNIENVLVAPASVD